MGEGTTRVEPGLDEATVSQRPVRLEHEVEAIRGNLTGIVSELDRRRHELLDWRLQLRRHAKLVATIGGLVAATLAMSILFGVTRRRRDARALTRVRKMRRAMARFVDDPDRVAPTHPSLGRKILGAGLGGAAGIIGKRAAETLIVKLRTA